MALRIYLRKNEKNDKVGTLNNWYAFVDNQPPIGIEDLAELIKEHNVGFSKGSIIGILRDMVSVIRRLVLNGQPVKIDDLAIFKAHIENNGGWSDLQDVSLHVGGDDDNIRALRLVAQATGDFTRAELTKEAHLVLDRQSQQMISAANNAPNAPQDGGGTTQPDNGDDDSSSDNGSGIDPVNPGGGGSYGNDD